MSSVVLSLLYHFVNFSFILGVIAVLVCLYPQEKLHSNVVMQTQSTISYKWTASEPSVSDGSLQVIERADAEGSNESGFSMLSLVDTSLDSANILPVILPNFKLLKERSKQTLDVLEKDRREMEETSVRRLGKHRRMRLTRAARFFKPLKRVVLKP